MTKQKITNKVLELIAREVGDCFSGSQIITILTDYGFQSSQIDYPNTKWVTVLEVFKLVRNDNPEDQDQAVADLIEHFLNPLNHEPHPENAEKLAMSVGRFLAYSKFEVIADDDKYLIITPDNQTDWNDVDRFFKEETAKENIKVVPEKKDQLYNLRDYHQTYIDVLEIFCENTKKPQKEHNEAYLKLAKKIPEMIEKLKLKHNKIEFYRPFSGDLYSAEIEWNGTDAIGDFRIGPKLSWDAVRPHLHNVHSFITKLIHIAEQEEEMTPDEKLLEKITGMVAIHRTEKANKKHQKDKVQKIEMTVLQDKGVKTTIISLSDFEIGFVDETAKVTIGNKISVTFPPHKNEHYILRKMFTHLKDEPVDWEDIFEEMTSTKAEAVDKVKIEKQKKAVRDGVNSINNRVKEVSNTDCNLLQWELKTVKRLY